MDHQQTTIQTKKFNLCTKLLNGEIAGVISLLTIFPLDMVKTRLQNQPIGPNGERQYKNMLDCFLKIYRTEGYFEMYRGLAVIITLSPLEKSIQFASNDYFCHKFTTSDGKVPMHLRVCAGGLAGICQNSITGPMELLKIRMQDAGRVAAAAGRPMEKLTATKIAVRLIRERGFFGLYRGCSVSIVRDIAFSAILFPLYSILISLGPRRNDDGTGDAVYWCSFLAGLTSGAVSAFSATPIDVIKTRIQAGRTEYTGILDCIRKTLKHEGIKGFFKGSLCRIVVIGPNYAIIQGVYYFGIGESILGYKKV